MAMIATAIAAWFGVSILTALALVRVLAFAKRFDAPDDACSARR